MHTTTMMFFLVDKKQCQKGFSFYSYNSTRSEKREHCNYSSSTQHNTTQQHTSDIIAHTHHTTAPFLSIDYTPLAPNQSFEMVLRFAVPDIEEEPSQDVRTKPSSSQKLGDCLRCHKKKITFECDPCGCPAFCEGCARKLASGGKCKICKAFYGGLRRVRDHSIT